METISITIPKEKEVLIKTAEYLRGLAGEGGIMVITGAPDLSPEAEAEAMGERIDKTVAAAGELHADGTETGDAGPPTHTPELDKEGIRWDVRIHASSKALVADGTWRLKRGVDAVLVSQVKAELLQGEEPVVAVAPVVPAVETPAPPPAVETPIATYAELIPIITERANSGDLLPRDVLDALKASGADLVGCASLPDLAKAEHAAYIPLVANELRHIWSLRVAVAPA